MKIDNPKCRTCKCFMEPLPCMEDGKVVCCSNPGAAFGRMEFQCPNCGRRASVPHQHKIKVLP